MLLTPTWWLAVICALAELLCWNSTHGLTRWEFKLLHLKKKFYRGRFIMTASRIYVTNDARKTCTLPRRRSYHSHISIKVLVAFTDSTQFSIRTFWNPSQFTITTKQVFLHCWQHARYIMFLTQLITPTLQKLSYLICLCDYLPW